MEVLLGGGDEMEGEDKRECNDETNLLFWKESGT